jgi:hypothetical protein
VSEPAVSSAARVVSFIYSPYYGSAGRVVATFSDGPSVPPTSRCTMPNQQSYSDTGTFSPTGTSFAYDDTIFDPNTFTTTVGQGIYTVELNLGSADCGASSAKLVLPGGAQPEWGPLAP